MRRFFAIAALGVLCGSGASAQEEDVDFLTAFLQESLSGAGRSVVVTGFSGALSSTASIEELTIADEAGIWLTLRGVSLDWSRSALLSGEVKISTLAADEIILERLPAPEEAAIASPEAVPFALPELPVSVEIGALSADRIVLGATVLGQPVEAQIAATLSLIGGEGSADISLRRIDDGPSGEMTLSASYGNESKVLSLDLDVAEDAGGIAAGLLGLPGVPSAALQISGEGPLTDFEAEIDLSTDGATRLAGDIVLLGEADGATRFSTNLRGDLAPMFLPDYAAFFGNEVALETNGALWPDGRLLLDQLNLRAQAITLLGSLSIAADGLPQFVDVTGHIGQPDASPVLLPLSGPEVRVQSADLDLRYVGGSEEGWSLKVNVDGFDQPDFTAEKLSLTGSGRIGRLAAEKQFGATLRFDVAGLAASDPAVAKALGKTLQGKAILHWLDRSDSVTIGQLNLTGEGFGAKAHGTVSGLETGLKLAGTVTSSVDDLSRLSALSGRPLGGKADLAATGNYELLSGIFDVVAQASGQDMRFGLDSVDGVLAGNAVVDLSALRNEAGTTVRQLVLTAPGVAVDVAGKISSTQSDLAGKVSIADLRRLGMGFRGALSGDARFTGSTTAGQITVTGTGSGLGVGQPEADKILAGQNSLKLSLSLKDGDIAVDDAQLSNPQVIATATGTVTGQVQTFDLRASLANLGLLVPDFPGALVVTGRAVQDAAGLAVDLQGKGPGQIDAKVIGTIAPDYGSAKLALSGTGQAALANSILAPRTLSGGLGFDLTLNGPFALSSLSGKVGLSAGKLADPSLNFGLQDITASAVLAGGSAQINAGLAVSSGGRVDVAGSSSLTTPFNGDLKINVNRVTLRDPELYATQLDGALTMVGPLLGGAKIAGAIALSQTELRVPSTGFGGAGGLPGLTHSGEAAPVYDTRVRAGLILPPETVAPTAGAGNYGLDVLVTAPNRIFLRGRGLDAELGGELRLLGTTSAVSPLGSFNLFRGRLEVLGKRLELSEALLQMEGDLVPFVRIVADTETDVATVGVLIEGPATDPKVSFTSTPDLPEEEVLAQLLFDSGLQNLSPLQALQLANAVAVLAGRGGEGVVGRLRKGFGLDNLDLKTDEEGAVSVTAGKYITEKIYSELTVGGDGKSQINLNLDVTKDVVVRGRASSDGSAGLGVFVEKDY